MTQVSEEKDGMVWIKFGEGFSATQHRVPYQFAHYFQELFGAEEKRKADKQIEELIKKLEELNKEMKKLREENAELKKKLEELDKKENKTEAEQKAAASTATLTALNEKRQFEVRQEMAATKTQYHAEQKKAGQEPTGEVKKTADGKIVVSEGHTISLDKNGDTIHDFASADGTIRIREGEKGFAASRIDAKGKEQTITISPEADKDIAAQFPVFKNDIQALDALWHAREEGKSAANKNASGKELREVYESEAALKNTDLARAKARAAISGYEAETLKRAQAKLDVDKDKTAEAAKVGGWMDKMSKRPIPEANKNKQQDREP